MKKILLTLVCAVFAALSLFGFAACGESDGDKVNLVGISSGTDVVARDDVDYFVVPEPAASLRVKAAGFHFVGDLQKLYGGENGYPQAVIVMKKSLGVSDWTGALYTAIRRNAEWLQNETTEISTIVGAVSNHLTDGMSPTFNENNLTKQVIANCGIGLYDIAYRTKTETLSFLTELKAVQPTINDSPDDNFFYQGYGVDGNDHNRQPDVLGEISIYAPDGAPALALAGLMAGAIDTSEIAETINYHIVDASTIQTYVTGNNLKADICILPVNLASNLLGNNANYTMLGTVTHGNIYILSANEEEEITVDNLEKLKGKTVAVVNLGAVPGLTFKLILNKNNIDYTESAE